MATKEDLISVNKYGQAVVTPDVMRDLILQGKNVSHLLATDCDEIELYKRYQSLLLSTETIFTEPPDETTSFEEFHSKCSDVWLFPKEYQDIDVKLWLLDKCKNDIEINRVNEEYNLFENHGLIMVLRLFIFLIDYMRENKYLWGVGRGSSVSSYILYLIGVHRIDSIKYNLPISDYLK